MIFSVYKIKIEFRSSQVAFKIVIFITILRNLKDHKCSHTLMMLVKYNIKCSRGFVLNDTQCAVNNVTIIIQSRRNRINLIMHLVIYERYGNKQFNYSNCHLHFDLQL